MCSLTNIFEFLKNSMLSWNENKEIRYKFMFLFVSIRLLTCSFLPFTFPWSHSDIYWFTCHGVAQINKISQLVFNFYEFMNIHSSNQYYKEQVFCCTIKIILWKGLENTAGRTFALHLVDLDLIPSSFYYPLSIMRRDSWVHSQKESLSTTGYDLKNKH